MAKVLCVLYPDPVTGYPPAYARDDVPVIKGYPNGQTVPSPQGELGFKPGDLIGCVSGELGTLRAHWRYCKTSSRKNRFVLSI